MTDAKKLAQDVWQPLKRYIEIVLSKRDKRITELQARLGELEQKNVSLERRASRHAEHLANLEDKLQRLK